MFRVLKVLIVFMFLLGGCQVNKGTNENLLPKDMDPADLPEGRAFEDEFTRSFLQSTEEMMPGYFPFLSMNGKYTMGFPKEGLLAKAYSSKEHQELLNISVWEEDAEIFADISVKYYGFLNQGFEESNKRTLETYKKIDLEFEEIKIDGQTLYISFFQDKETFEGVEEIYGYVGYLQNNVSAGGMDIFYTSYCKSNCEDLKETDLKQAYEWMKSVRFIQDKEKEGE